MSKETDIGYEFKQSLPNKLIKEDGSVTDFAGNPVVAPVEAYNSKPALPNKWLNPDGSYSTLNEIVSSLLDSEIFIIVDELPETGVSNKIYLLVSDNKLVEYLWVNNKWDPVGMVEFDINNYYTKTEVTNLISAALQSAESYANTNFLKKDNTTEYTPTADYHPATKKYVDDHAGSNDQQIFYYNFGESSAATLEEFTRMYNLNKTKDVILVVNYRQGTADKYISLYFDIPKGYLIDNNGLTPRIYFTKPYIMTSSVAQMLTYYLYFQLTIVNDTVTYIMPYSSGNGGIDGRIRYLDTNYNYPTPYTPLYDGSPATKKYVDDSIANNITSVLGGEY